MQWRNKVVQLRSVSEGSWLLLVVQLPEVEKYIREINLGDTYEKHI